MCRMWERVNEERMKGTEETIGLLLLLFSKVRKMKYLPVK